MKTRKITVNFFVTSRVETNIEVPVDMTDEQVKRTLLRATYNPSKWVLIATEQMIAAADKIEGTVDWQDYEGFSFGDKEGN